MSAKGLPGNLVARMRAGMMMMALAMLGPRLELERMALAPAKPLERTEVQLQAEAEFL